MDRGRDATGDRHYVRLDCLAENPGIRGYYERCGFHDIDEREIDGTRYSLYELALKGASGASSPP